ncbi:MAG: MBL fold metallo-hydrolase [Clostridiales bacterium]|nr:MBL fold metallo-hydrolase [Clostridiales bacterium]
MSKGITITPLYSGSSGNAILMSSEQTHVLVDAGMSCKKLVEALNAVRINPFDLNAILITHDHSDHISALDVFTRKFNIPIYATGATWRGIHAAEKKPHSPHLDNEIIPGTKTPIGDFEVLAFDTPHDAQGSCGYRFESEGHVAAIATDIGVMTPVIFEQLRGCEGILLEANYDNDMLWNGAYPYYLKKRIAGEGGHLCNEDCASTIVKLCKSGTKHFILGHLSVENNLPQVAERAVLLAMETEKLVRDVDYTLRIANRYTPTAPLWLGDPQ